MARLLLVWQSRTGRTRSLMEAVAAGVDSVAGVELRTLSAVDADVADLLWADAYLLGCAEHFGSMAGLFKDFLERVYDPLLGCIAGRPYALFVAAGNDGRGAVASIDRVLRGLQLKCVQEAVIWRGNDPAFTLDTATELGATVATGLQMGLW